MESENVVCPVCTLYLRPGITLKAHLTSHPKQKVIEALVRLSNSEQVHKSQSNNENVVHSQPSNVTVNPTWNQANPLPVNSVPPTFSGVQGNHSFIYQQFMSTSSQQPNVLNVNPMSQQYVTIPAVFNPQMMCSPYMYQQQQVIMSSGPAVQSMIPRPLPIESTQPELSSTTQQNSSASVPASNTNIISFERLQEPDLVIIEQPNEQLQEPDIIIIEQSADTDGDINVSDDNHDTSTIKDSFEQEVNHLDLNNSQHHSPQVQGPHSPLSVPLTIENVIKHDSNEAAKFEIKDDIKDAASEDGHISGPCDHLIDDFNENMQEFEKQVDNLGSPRSSNGSDWNLKIKTDLSKACQTHQTTNSYSDFAVIHEDMENLNNMPIVETVVEEKEQPYFNHDILVEPVVTTGNLITLTGGYEQNDPIYTAANSGIQTTDQASYMDIDGMHLVLTNDFMSNQLISQVEDFDCINNRSDKANVLMNIGGMDGSRDTFNDQREIERLGEESMSRESINVSIRADERMPPRGELSGQESNGGVSDIAWSRIQYHEGSSGMSTSYDLLARESWEGSDVSDIEVPTLQSRIPPHIRYTPDIDDTPTLVSVTEPPLNYKCSTCGEGFKCPKERRVHQTEQHKDKNETVKAKGSNVVIGSKITKKRVKKLIIKPKKTEIKTENNFDNVFTNKLKLETISENDVSRVTALLPPDLPLEIEKCEDKLKSESHVCSVCDNVLPSGKELRQHKLEIHNIASVELRHKCNTCDDTFPNEAKYNEHLRVHPLECRLCGKYFYRRQNIKLHMKRHLGIRPYKCDVCEKCFLTKQKHDEHKNVHTGEAPIKCTMCDESFRRHSNLVQHRNIHHFNLKRKVKDYICLCGEIFHSKKKLAWHKEIHEPKPKACLHCSEKFIHMSSLTRHMRRAHNDRFLPKEHRSSENVECHICKGVYLRSSLDVHIRNHSGQRPYTCLICNKDFTTKWNLKLHKWTHASRMSKPYKCDQCKGAFIRETDYTAHMNSHRSVRPYTCNFCGAQFIRKYNCQRHVREHEKSKTFNCQVCGKSFHRSYYLKDHMRVHSGVRPYSCHICGKTSTTKSNHNKHVRIHHAREPVSTEN